MFGPMGISFSTVAQTLLKLLTSMRFQRLFAIVQT